VASPDGGRLAFDVDEDNNRATSDPRLRARHDDALHVRAGREFRPSGRPTQSGSPTACRAELEPRWKDAAERARPELLLDAEDKFVTDWSHDSSTIVFSSRGETSWDIWRCAW
jgi:hypothetical protein